MDRRGSGIRRVMNSYADFDIKPVFYSNEYFFLVSLPNRGNELRNGMKSNKTQLIPDKTQLTEVNVLPPIEAGASCFIKNSTTDSEELRRLTLSPQA